VLSFFYVTTKYLKQKELFNIVIEPIWYINFKIL
jgi:hypothetical protein